MTFISPQLISWRSIDEAAEWHNQLEWIGLATTPKLSMHYLGSGYERRTNNYIHYPKIPIKKDNYEAYSPLYIGKKGCYEGLALNFFDKEDNLYDLLTHEMNKQSHVKIKRKYQNTLDFLDYCSKIHLTW